MSAGLLKERMEVMIVDDAVANIYADSTRKEDKRSFLEIVLCGIV